MSEISFHVRIHGEDIQLGRVNVPDGSERSGAEIGAAMHEVAERVQVWSLFRRATEGMA